MAIAQQLYEGIDISGEGTVGLITYMRTDSLRLSDEALAAAKDFIQTRYGAEYYPPQTRHYKTKAGAQDAHEAIRPSDVTLTPERIKGDLTSEQFRLYRLIWSRFLACQMANAVYDSVSVEAAAAGNSFRANYSALKFSGYTAVYEEGKDDDTGEQKELAPACPAGRTEPLERRCGKRAAFYPASQPLYRCYADPCHGGAGHRPSSTYAPTVSTILDREYVIKDGKYLRITPLGEVVTGLMKEKFPAIVNTSFTANMEKNLDRVEEGEENWKGLLHAFYTPFCRFALPSGKGSGRQAH